MEKTQVRIESMASSPKPIARKIAAGQRFSTALSAYASGGQKEIFDQACLQFVEHVVQETSASAHEPEEALQIGMVALLEALQDHERHRYVQSISAFVRQRMESALLSSREADPEMQHVPLKRGMRSRESAQEIPDEQERLKGRIRTVLKTLPYREREIIKLRYGFVDDASYTLEEIGTIFKVTAERIRAIEAKAMRKLRQPYRAQELEGFL